MPVCEVLVPRADWVWAAGRPSSARAHISPEPEMLQEGKYEHVHGRMVMQAYLASALEVVEPDFALHLLVRLLATPAGLDRPCQRPEPSSGRMIAQVVLVLTACSALADEAGLFARKVLPPSGLDAIGHPNPMGCEVAGDRALGALAPGYPVEGALAERPDCLLGAHARHRQGRVLSRPIHSLGWKRKQFDICRIDLLCGQDADRIAEAPLAEAPAEVGARAVVCIGQNAAEACAGGMHTIELGKRDLVLGAEGDALGHAGLPAPLGVVHPRLGQVEPERGGDGHFGLSEGERDQGLAISPLAELAAVLAGHIDGALTLIDERGVVDDEHGIRAADQPVGLTDEQLLQRSALPAQGADQVVELLTLSGGNDLGQVGDAHSIARPTEPSR